jgi:hypothetical protein
MKSVLTFTIALFITLFCSLSSAFAQSSCPGFQVTLISGSCSECYSATVQIDNYNDPVNGVINITYTTNLVSGTPPFPDPGLPASFTGSGQFSFTVGDVEHFGGVNISFTDQCCNTAMVSAVNFDGPANHIKRIVNSVAGTCVPSVIFLKEDLSTLPSPFRVPLTTKVKIRKKTILASLGKGISASDVDFLSSPNLILSTPVQLASDLLKIEVQGTVASDPLNEADAWIKAVKKQSPITVYGQAFLSIPVPTQFMIPFNPTGNLTQPYQAAININSPPPSFPTIPANQVCLVTIFKADVTLVVLDQFDKLVGDLYKGAEIYERRAGETDFNPTHIFLQADSSYIDPVGTALPKAGFGMIAKSTVSITNRSIISAWLKMKPPQFPLPHGTVEQLYTIKVDGEFELSPMIRRNIDIYNRPYNVKVTYFY